MLAGDGSRTGVVVNDDARTIRDRSRLAARAASALREASLDERIAWLVATAEALAKEVEGARAHLAEETGLSAPMVEWGARTTLDSIQPDTLRRVADAAGRSNGGPLSLLAVVLAGNLFTASIRAVFVPLLLGVPVLAKSASRETAFASMVERALERADPKLGESMQLVVYRGGEVEPEAALLESAGAIAVYGADETVDEIRRRHPEVPIIAHGHGVSAAYCSADALTNERLDDTVRALALDICAYDQRGCLSPQIVYVEEAPHCPVDTFAERLATNGLEPMGRRLPRGPLPIDVGAAQAQWRGLAEIEGNLIAGDGFSIAIRSAADPIRWSPGYRNISLVPVAGAKNAVASVEPLGASLKCVGAVAESLEDLEGRLRRSRVSSAYACPLGSMQTPAFDAPADGKPVWHGLVR